MKSHYLRNIALLLLVLLASQQVVALASHSVEHSPDGCHEQLASVDCPSDNHSSHKMKNSSLEASVCDHCSAFCKLDLSTSLHIPPFEKNQSISSTELISLVITPAISILYRPPILVIAY